MVIIMWRAAQLKITHFMQEESVLSFKYVVTLAIVESSCSKMTNTFVSGVDPLGDEQAAGLWLRVV